MPPLLHRPPEAGGQRWPRRALPAPLRRPLEEEVGLVAALDPERRAALLAGKLRSLVARSDDAGDLSPASFPSGAALLGRDRAWVLVEGDATRALGPALARSRRAGAARLDLVVDGDGAGVAARQASLFDSVPRVWRVAGTGLEPVAGEPLAADPPLDERLAAKEATLLAAGCDVVVEHGRLVGEVLGLEVVRVELVDGSLRVEVGVGRFDREAHRELSGDDDPSPGALERVVRLVREQRRPGAAPTPLTRLAPERRLRAVLVEDPALVGAEALRPVAPVAEAALRTPAPAPAVGTAGGRPVVVVASSGIDLGLVPDAADVRLREGPEADLVLAVPERDASPVTADLARALARPARLVGVPIP